MANSLNCDLENKVVRFREGALKPEFKDAPFLCTGGFGCHDYTRGGAIFGTFIDDGEKCRMEGFEVREIVEESSLSPEQQEKLAQIRNSK